jgi:hypothetical protein
VNRIAEQVLVGVVVMLLVKAITEPQPVKQLPPGK